ncbi:hypothetical protein FUA48_16445 [Flavobacterium alkalisoli]|uniref:Uncharacterized protein n=1 Tax=Flavobacterium alkalisoli TaxID=2602769 RepID=A0A5B9FVZ7_9FLAO|nr:hypothetical protein [Flavobacterium alkalisoli]QEE51105.1 hypothetical protein FUA48_16445 [Flavobacterium alkalisoli]
MKLKKFSILCLLLGSFISFTSCENEAAENETITTKSLTKVYESTGEYNSNLDGWFSVYLPDLPAGSNYKFYTDQIYNLSRNDGVTTENAIVIFMEIEGIDDYNLTEERGVVQPAVQFNLNNLIDVSGNAPLDTSKDITLIIAHDDELDISWVVDSYFNSSFRLKIPAKIGFGGLKKV